MYFNRLTECGLHVDLLPYVVCPGHKAGTLQFEWCGISPGVTVLAALGDVQCAVYSVLKSQQDAGWFKFWLSIDSSYNSQEKLNSVKSSGMF